MSSDIVTTLVSRHREFYYFRVLMSPNSLGRLKFHTPGIRWAIGVSSSLHFYNKNFKAKNFESKSI